MRTDSAHLRQIAGEAQRDDIVVLVNEALAGLRYGTIVITVQDGVVVQIERTERRRFIKPPSPPPISGSSRS